MRKTNRGVVARLCTLVAAVLAAWACAGCESDSYETGTGDFSLMQADLADIHVNAEKRVTDFVTDEGEQLSLLTPVTTQWIQTPDTTYRAIVYYNRLAGQQAEAIAMGTVTTLIPVPHWRYKEQPEDPLGLESVWLARNGKYLNLGLLIKSGRIDDEELSHVIGLAQDTVVVNANQTRTAYYRLLHSQNGVPEYYTNRRYASILLPDERPDSIRLTIQTYDGRVEKILVP